MHIQTTLGFTFVSESTPCFLVFANQSINFMFRWVPFATALPIKGTQTSQERHTWFFRLLQRDARSGGVSINARRSRTTGSVLTHGHVICCFLVRLEVHPSVVVHIIGSLAHFEFSFGESGFKAL
jgi:hypothetical protein